MGRSCWSAGPSSTSWACGRHRWRADRLTPRPSRSEATCRGGRAAGMSGPRDWDAATYDRIADPMTRWGATSSIACRCGATRRCSTPAAARAGSPSVLAEALPRGRVIALDGSPAMLDEAPRRAWRHSRPRIEFVLADLREAAARSRTRSTRSCRPRRSTGCPTTTALFRNLAAVLRPGGRLVAQCGGAGNIAAVRRSWPRSATAGRVPGRSRRPPRRERRLDGGRLHRDRDLAEARADAPGARPGRPRRSCARSSWATTSPGCPEAEREPFVRAVAERMARPEIDYVRLNINARRGI